MFADNLVLYIESSADSTKKLLELIHKFSKVAGYKINTQKSFVSIHYNNTSEKDIKKTIPFTRASKTKHSEINITKLGEGYVKL